MRKGIKHYIALDEENNNVWVEMAVRGKKYKCPDKECGSVLTLVSGEKNATHFRHESNTTCKGAMTPLHREAEKLLSEEINQIRIKAFTYKGKVLFKPRVLIYSEAIKEPLKHQRDGHRFKPDVYATLSDGSKIWIEVTVTSRTDGEKLKYLKGNGVFAINFDLSCIDRCTSKAALKAILLSDKYVKYLSHPEGKKKAAIIDKLILDEIEKRNIRDIEAKRRANLPYIEWLTPDMKRRQHEYQQSILSPNITDEHARHNHNEWIKRAKKGGWRYISYEEFLITDFTK